MTKKNILIIGGGVSGLSVAWQIAKADLGIVTVLEAAPDTGGICRTLEWGDFKADLGPHKIFSFLPGVIDETLSLFGGEEVIKHKKHNRLFLAGNYLNYPINFRDILKTMGLCKLFAIGISLINIKIEKFFSNKNEKSYKDYLVNRFGRELYNLVFDSLALKVWGDPETLSMHIARARIPASNAFGVLLRSIGLKKEMATTNAAFFYYPKKGFGQIPHKLHTMIEKLNGKIITNVSNIKLFVEGKAISRTSWLSNGKQGNMTPDLVISAIPFHELLKSIIGSDFSRTVKLAEQLPYRHTLLVYLFFDKPKILDDHWIFIPDKNIIFSRIYEPKVLSKEMGPSNKTLICCDLTASDYDSVWKMSDEELGSKCIEGLEKMYLINKNDEVRTCKVIRIKSFYPRYEIGYREKLSEIMKEISKVSNIICTGRLGMYNYNNFDHCMHMAMIIARELEAGSPVAEICNKLLDASLGYRIVD